MSLIDFFRQVSLLIGLPAVLIAGAAAALIVIARDWRLSVLAYAVFSVMIAILLSQVIPTEWALQQIIVGGIVAVMLYLSARQLSYQAQSGFPAEARWPRMASLTSFRLLAVGLLMVVFFAARQQVAMPLVDALFGDALLWLFLISLAGLALHEEPLHAGLCLLVFLGAAELLLFTLTQRRMMVGLWQALQLLLGLAVAYLALARGLTGAAWGQEVHQDTGGSL